MPADRRSARNWFRGASRSARNWLRGASRSARNWFREASRSYARNWFRGASRSARNLFRGPGFLRAVRRPLGLITRALAGAICAAGATLAVAVAVATAAGSSGGVPSSTVVATTPTTSATNTPPSSTTPAPTPTNSTTPAPTPTAAIGSPRTIPVPQSNPFTGRAMWIWQLSQTDGGNIAQIIATAERYRIGTLLIKSSDGATVWSQFNARLVTALHEAGLKVCAWQFVYGSRPVVEARLGARAVRDGADCLVIDAESAYQGRYAPASTYMTTLRRLIGRSFPLGLAGFPYVDYHLNFPYSVFLGPGGAQYNLPQMYWADIGVSVSTVFEHTYAWNEIYERPIYPLGQLFGRLSGNAIEQFNTLAAEYGATGVSWWDWQSAPPTYFADIDNAISPPYGFMLDRAAVTIKRRDVGDPVVWAQQHLVAAGFRLAIDGSFAAATQRAVKSFQSQHGLPATGEVDAATWIALDKYPAVTVRWVQRKRGAVAIVAAVDLKDSMPKAASPKASMPNTGSPKTASPKTASPKTSMPNTGSHKTASPKTSGEAGSAQVTEPVPAWASDTADRDELHGEPGAGGPARSRAMRG